MDNSSERIDATTVQTTDSVEQTMRAIDLAALGIVFIVDTERLSDQVLTLPIYPSLTEEKIDYIADEMAAFFLNENP